MKGAPRLGLRLIGRLLPPELAGPIQGDLEEGYRRRAAGGGRLGRLGAQVWFWGQVARIPWLRLRRRARRLTSRTGVERREGEGAEMTMTGRRWTGGMESLWMDLRVAARTLARRPAFAVTTILTLTLSIGAATLLFSVTEGVILRPLPYASPDRVVGLYLLNYRWRDGDNELLRRGWDRHNVQPRHVEAFRGVPGTLEAAGFWAPTLGELEWRGEEEAAWGVRVDRGVFPSLAVEPALGRLPTADELETGARVAVLRYDLWQQRFGGSPDVVGETFRFKGEVHTVVGIMPAGFFFPRESDFWSPIPVEEADYFGHGVGRLAPGVSAAEASVVLDRVAVRLGEEDPALAHFGARALPVLDDMVGGVRGGVLLLLVTALVVLLVACVNLANLVLVRGARRRGELAVRAAMGAPRGSLVGAVFSEVGIVCAAGGMLGLGAAALLLDPFVSSVTLSVGGLPRAEAVELNGTVLAFTVAATMATALLAGLPAGMGAARRAPAEALGQANARGGGRAGRRGRSALLTVQTALAALLLTGAGLLVTTALRAGGIDPGFEVEGLAWLRLSLDEDGSSTRAERSATLERLGATAARVPDVASVAFASGLPIQDGLGLPSFRDAGAPEEEARPVGSSRVSPAYFATLRLPLLRGGVPEEPRVEGEPEPAVVTETLARALEASGPVLGRRLIQGLGDRERFLVVRGVVADARHFLLENPTEHVYVVDRAVGGGEVAMLIRSTAADASAVIARVRTGLAAAAPAVEIEDQGTVQAQVSEATRHLRLRALLMSGLAGLAALLAVVGIAGIAAWFLAEQRHEIAVRLALGARSGGQVRSVLWHALVPAGTGVLAGLGAALVLARLLTDLLFATSPGDLATYVVVGSFLLLVSGVAAGLPAWRAAAVDPARVLDRG